MLTGGTLRWQPLRSGSLHNDGCRPDEHQDRRRALIGAPSAVFGGIDGRPFMHDAGCTKVVPEPER